MCVQIVQAMVQSPVNAWRALSQPAASLPARCAWVRTVRRLGHERCAEVHFDDVLTRDLGEGVVLLSSAARARWNYEKVAGVVLCATVYRKQASHWRVALHQQTLVQSGA